MGDEIDVGLLNAGDSAQSLVHAAHAACAAVPRSVSARDARRPPHPCGRRARPRRAPRPDRRSRHEVPDACHHAARPVPHLELEPERAEDRDDLVHAHGGLAVLQLVEEREADRGNVRELDLGQAERAPLGPNCRCQGVDPSGSSLRSHGFAEFRRYRHYAKC